MMNTSPSGTISRIQYYLYLSKSNEKIVWKDTDDFVGNVYYCSNHLACLWIFTLAPKNVLPGWFRVIKKIGTEYQINYCYGCVTWLIAMDFIGIERNKNLAPVLQSTQGRN